MKKLNQFKVEPPTRKGRQISISKRSRHHSGAVECCARVPRTESIKFIWFAKRVNCVCLCVIGQTMRTTNPIGSAEGGYASTSTSTTTATPTATASSAREACVTCAQRDTSVCRMCKFSWRQLQVRKMRDIRRHELLASRYSGPPLPRIHLAEPKAALSSYQCRLTKLRLGQLVNAAG